MGSYQRDGIVVLLRAEPLGEDYTLCLSLLPRGSHHFRSVVPESYLYRPFQSS